MPIAAANGEERRICAIGDVHGCSLQLSALLDCLEAGSQEGREEILVFLGDLHDRGPDGLGCLDLAIGAAERKFSQVIGLMGNHEQMLRLTIDNPGPDDLELWYLNGGHAVLLQLAEQGFIPANPEESDAWSGGWLADALGPRRMDWLEALTSHVRFGDLLFVHAGINHSQSLEQHFAQPWYEIGSELHWAWIREEFLFRPVSIPGVVVVHGHTMVRYSPPDFLDDRILLPHLERGGRINLDSGSHVSGCVAAAEFTGGSWRIVVASGPPADEL